MPESTIFIQIPQTQRQEQSVDSQSINDKKTTVSLKWTVQENKRYIDFLKENRTQFRNEKNRRAQKIFDKMSKSLLSRNARQCRTHHLKMVITHKTPYRIIKYLEGKIGKESALIQEKLNDFEFNSQNFLSSAREDRKQKQIWKMIDTRCWTLDQGNNTYQAYDFTRKT